MEKLKEEGHRLLDEYKLITRTNSIKAYAELERRLKGKTPHFGQMRNREEVVLAIGMLKKMIVKEKYAKDNL
jgi:hypothetical protein